MSAAKPTAPSTPPVTPAPRLSPTPPATPAPRRSPTSTKPSTPSKPRDIIKGRAAEFLPEIQRRFGRKSFKPTHLGDGGAGVVYRVGPSKVVKVMLGESKYTKVQHYKRLFKQLTRQTSQPLKDVYEHFYVHSSFHTSRGVNSTTKVPHFVYELMEYMPSDLKGFSKKNRWTCEEFKSILCQVMHGLNLFHRIGYVVTDLKVDNVLINPVTGQIKLNDFCESYNVHTRSSCMYTYRNFPNRHTPKEDVWRLALLVVEFLHPRVMHLVKEHHLRPPEKKDYLRSIRGRLKRKQRYNYEQMIAKYVMYQKNVLMKHDATHRGLWTHLFYWLVRMLDNDPNKRPTLHQLLTSRLFCEACFTPRTNFRYAFGEHYVKSEPLPSLKNTSGSRSGSYNATDTHIHTPNTASSNASLSVPSTTATTHSPTIYPSSSHKTTKSRRKHRRRHHVTSTIHGSSNRHHIRTRRARKYRPWAISSNTKHSSRRRRRHRRTRHRKP